MRTWFALSALAIMTVARAEPVPPGTIASAPQDPSTPVPPDPATSVPRDPATSVPPNPGTGCPQQPSEPIRRRPGEPAPETPLAPECDLSRLPPPAPGLPPPEPFDRWRVIDSLGYPDNWRNPYATNNPLKGDRPLDGHARFFSLTASSASLVESRRVATDGAAQGTGAQSATSVQQLFASETVSVDAVLYSGDTIFRPPDYQLRITPIFNYSNTHTNDTNAGAGSVGAQALFFEKHLRDVSANYDFDSVRLGIQPLISDFRGFVLSDQPVGVRLFGTRGNNVYQYNLGWFRLLPKNANRQNELGHGVLDNDLVLANLYVQDLWRPGLTSEFVALYDRSHVPASQLLSAPVPGTPATFVDSGPHDYRVLYLGYGVDGHLGRFNLTALAYGVLGHEQGGTFGTADTKVRAGFAAFELSRDYDWTRLRLSGLYASGDGSPFDDHASGFDGVSQSALFAGADATFFIHQRLPLVAGQLDLKVRDGLFPSLHSTAYPWQSNYVNPGLRLAGLGADFDLAPVLRVSLDANYLWFDQTAPLVTIVGNPALSRDLGTDLALDVLYRPLNSQNVIVRLAAAKLFATTAARQLVGGEPFSGFATLVLTY